MTTRGIKEAEVKHIVEFMDQAFKHRENEEILAELRQKVRSLALQFPVPSL
jgi:glycine/serine hydroxymethyltransferase